MKTTIIEKEKLIENTLAQPAKLPEQVKEILNSEDVLAYALIDGIVEQAMKKLAYSYFNQDLQPLNTK